MKVAIYCRVSTDEQDADKQEYICSEYCKRNNWKIYNVYKDIISGTKQSRPSFNKLLDDMRGFKFDAIIVSKLDRIGRSLSHLLSLLDEFNKKKIKFISATQNIDTTTSMGVLQLQMMGAFSEFERNIISERTKEALKYAKNVGKRGKDKKPRKRRAPNTVYKIRTTKQKTKYIKQKIKVTKQEELKLYKRSCKRCKERYETKFRTSKICKKCRGVTKS